MYGKMIYVCLLLIVISESVIWGYDEPKGGPLLAAIVLALIHTVLVVVNLVVTSIEAVVFSERHGIPFKQVYGFTFKTNIISLFLIFFVLLLFIHAEAILAASGILAAAGMIFPLVSQQAKAAKKMFFAIGDDVLRRYVFILNVVAYLQLSLWFMLNGKKWML